MESALIGKTVLVTGAAKRVGRSIVHELHASGANVVVHYRAAADAAASLVSELEAVRPDSALMVQADLLDTATLDQLVAKTVDRFGRLDALVNNASSFFPTPVGQINDAAWDDLVGSNFKAPLFLSQAAAPWLQKSRGSIVNIVDIHGERPLAGYPLYCAAKAALIGLTRALAVELAPEVRVNGVAPGPVLWPESEGESHFDPAERERIIAHTLLKHAGSPADIARAVRYLICDATYTTGQILNVDGGRTTHL